VDTTVRDETAEMDPGTVLLGPSERLDDVFLLGKFLLLDA
jgi:hypothetical protein